MARPAFDPLLLPITAISNEPAIDPSLLSPERLRQSFLQPRIWTPEDNDEQRLRTGLIVPTPAAVLVPLVMREHGLTVLLTQRTAHLNDHAGQVSFPGGRVEPEDRSIVDTALRETEEEIGLGRQLIETIGHLPDYFTGTGYRVTPVVSLILPPFDLAPDEFEVAEIFEVPLAFLMDPANHQVRAVPAEFGSRTFYAMPYGRHFIWGATAGMLRNFYRFLAAQFHV